LEEVELDELPAAGLEADEQAPVVRDLVDAAEAELLVIDEVAALGQLRRLPRLGRGGARRRGGLEGQGDARPLRGAAALPRLLRVARGGRALPGAGPLVRGRRGGRGSRGRGRAGQLPPDRQAGRA